VSLWKKQACRMGVLYLSVVNTAGCQTLVSTHRASCALFVFWTQAGHPKVPTDSVTNNKKTNTTTMGLLSHGELSLTTPDTLRFTSQLRFKLIVTSFVNKAPLVLHNPMQCERSQDNTSRVHSCGLARLNIKQFRVVELLCVFVL
jgi:hypothetical protein